VPVPSPTPDRAATERLFRRAGLPTFIEGYSAGRGIFNRALWFFTAVALLEVFNALNRAWPLAANVAAVAGAALVLVGLYAGLNHLRGRRPLELPRHFGLVEGAFFLLAPALLPLAFNGQWRSALVTLAANLVLLGLVYLVVGYGLVATFFWGLAKVGGELVASLGRLLRLLPLLLIFALAMFFSTELWAVFDALSGVPALVVTGMCTGLILVCLASRLPGQTRELEHEGLATAGDDRPLSRRQRANLAVVVAGSELLQLVVVSVGIAAFFLVLGVCAVPPAVLDEWKVGTGWTWDLVLGRYTFVVARTHVTVALGLAGLSSLYYAIMIVTDRTYRDDFLAGMRAELARVFAARRAYLAAAAPPGPEEPGRPGPVVTP
jgi:hypothetical protein